MNQLLVYLHESPFRYDPSAFTPMCRAFLNATPQEREEFTRQARTMPYKEFLRTMYWGVISGWMVSLNPQCRRCKSRRFLNVHHLTYEVHGEEHRRLDFMEVLCRNCHTEGHNLATAERLIDNRIYRDRLSILPNLSLKRKQQLVLEQMADAAALGKLKRHEPQDSEDYSHKFLGGIQP